MCLSQHTLGNPVIEKLHSLAKGRSTKIKISVGKIQCSVMTYYVKFVFEKDKNKQKRDRGWPI